MAWGRLDDGFDDHPKVVALLDEADLTTAGVAVGLWTLCWTWAHRNTRKRGKTPGLIPAAGLSGYSKHVFSAQAFYETGPISIQGIYRYRSRYQAFTSNNTQLRYVEGYNTFDLTTAVKLNKQIDFRFQALNLFNEPRVEYMPVVGSTRNVEYYGPQYFLSMRVRIR